MLKVELHAHTDADPADRIRHTTRQLIDRAAALGYGAVALTLHDRQQDVSEYAAYALERGIVLLPGVERTIGRVHILLVNFPAAASLGVRRLDDIPQLKYAHPDGLVVVPHPFYPVASALGPQLDDHQQWVDALEVNSMYTRWLDFNRRAIQWAKAHGKPLVGNTDLHTLSQMGTTYSLVDAPPEANAICRAIRDGRVEVHSRPLRSWPALALFAGMVIAGIQGPPRRARQW